VRFLLDTDICIYAMDARPEVLRRLDVVARQDIGISVITEAELRAGAAKSNAPLRASEQVDLLLSPFQILEFSSPDAAAFAQIRSKLERAGTPIGPLDTLIAAHAVARHLTLVTNNEREFQRVPGLKIENWSRG